MEYNLGDLGAKSRDFSNPMYDALGGESGGGVGGTGPGNGSGIYEVPADVAKSKFNADAGVVSSPEPASAILAPSSVIQRSSPQIHIRHRELDPTSVDTGKDTQKLVEEDRSDC